MIAALSNEIFVTYLAIVGGVLGVAGLALAALSLAGRKVGSIAQTYRGWLVMAPIVMATLALGRTATIVGIALLAAFGFKEFAKATGLYRDWWMTGIVYAGISALAGASLAIDPRLGRLGWYGLFMALPVYVIAMILLVPIVRNAAKGQLQRVALAMLGFIYFGWMFSHLGFLANTPNAYGYLLFLFFAVGLNDVAAFTFGKVLGRRKLREHISPNKTVAGLAGRRRRLAWRAVGVGILATGLRAAAPRADRAHRRRRRPIGRPRDQLHQARYRHQGHGHVDSRPRRDSGPYRQHDLRGTAVLSHDPVVPRARLAPQNHGRLAIRAVSADRRLDRRRRCASFRASRTCSTMRCARRLPLACAHGSRLYHRLSDRRP